MNRKARISSISTVYFEDGNGGTMHVDTRCSRWLDTADQPYSRQLIIDAEWQTLDTGWLKAASVVVIENKAMSDMQRQPTPAERQTMQAMVLQIGFQLPVPVAASPIACLKVRPSDSARLEFADISLVRLRSPYGPIKCIVTVLPE